MIVVGVGVGPKMITREAIEAISSAPAVYGSRRAIELAQEYIECEAQPIKSFKNLHLLPEDAVILSTGDPMFSGLGKFAGENDHIITGISSIQASCAKFHVRLSNLAMITAHGRNPALAKEEMIRELELGKNIFLLPADGLGPQEIASILKEMNMDAKICIYEDIGYPYERAVVGCVANPPLNKSEMYCLMVVR